MTDPRIAAIVSEAQQTVTPRQKEIIKLLQDKRPRRVPSKDAPKPVP